MPFDLPTEHTKLIDSPTSGGASTSWSVFLNLTMTAVGAGCMAIPYTLVASGYVLGVFLLLLCAVMSGGSLVVLTHLTRRTGRTDYSEIAEEVLGYPGRVLTIVGIFMLLIGASAAFVDISTDLLYPFAVDVASELTTRIVIASLMALMSLPRTMHALRHISFVGMSCLLYILLGVLYHIGQTNRDLGISVHPSHVSASVQPFKPGLGVILALNLQSMAFMCHPSLPILYAELRRDCKHQMEKIVQLSVAVSFIFYFLMAAGHFYVQGGHPSGNLLADYGSGDSMMSIAKFVLSMVLILKSPLIFRPLHSLAYSTFGLGTSSQLAGVVECFAYYSFLVVLTEMVPDLVTLMSWSGLTCGALIGFILPGVMLIVDAGRVEPMMGGSPAWTKGNKARLIGAAIAASGVCITVFGPFTIGFVAT